MSFSHVLLPECEGKLSPLDTNLSWKSASDWLTAHAAAVQALASVSSVILAGILLWTTIRYARSTADILEESRKSRKAVESQASASQAQATAAFKPRQRDAVLTWHAVRRAVLGFQFKVVPLKIERDAPEVGHCQQA